MPQILLDTNIFIDMIRGYDPTIQRVKQLENTAEIVTSVITCLELIVGCQNKESLKTSMSLVETFDILPITAISSARAIDLMKQYSLSHGLLEADALIAAIALENNLPYQIINTRGFERRKMRQQ
jgi:predicted nucleic acid-binding protein